tara:strand:+ start:7474 stop:7749 length:276 start_codon:yes stop_codon:yes gene_type:complete
MFGYKTAKRTSNGNLTTGPARVIAVHAVCGASAGQIELKDGTGGTLLFDIDTPGSATAMVETYIGDEGIRFQDKVHVSLTNITSISIIYSG